MTMPTLMVLRRFLDSDGPLFGREMVEAGVGASGVVYPILNRLARAGWLAAVWEDIDPSEAGRPRRRIYALTDEGRDEAEKVMAELRGEK